MMLQISAAILAGGKNSRMGGRNKALLKINGLTIMQRTISILKNIFDEIIIVTDSPGEFNDFKENCQFVFDIIKESGPLAGIHAALSFAKKEAVFFVACDMPFLHNEIIRKQLEKFNKLSGDVFVPRIGLDLEPLHAIYKKGLKDKIFSYLKTGQNLSLRNFMETVDVRFFDLEDTPFHRLVFKNVNTEKDLKEIKNYAESKIKDLA